MTEKPTIAVVGALKDHGKFSNKCVRAYLEAGYEVFPVTPRASEIEGQRVYENLRDVPVDLDRISVYLPPALTMELLSEIAAKGADKVFFNPGSADHRVLNAARDANIPVMAECSILAIGRKPSEFP